MGNILAHIIHYLCKVNHSFSITTPQYSSLFSLLKTSYHENFICHQSACHQYNQLTPTGRSHTYQQCSEHGIHSRAKPGGHADADAEHYLRNHPILRDTGFKTLFPSENCKLRLCRHTSLSTDFNFNKLISKNLDSLKLRCGHSETERPHQIQYISTRKIIRYAG